MKNPKEFPNQAHQGYRYDKLSEPTMIGTACGKAKGQRLNFVPRADLCLV
jgi:hypothetical protein